MNASSNPLSRLRTALGSRQAAVSGADSGVGAPSADGSGAPSGGLLGTRARLAFLALTTAVFLFAFAAQALAAHGTITIGAAPGSTGEGLVTNLNGTGGETLHCEISGETAEGECTTYFEGFLDELEIEASGEGGASFVEWVEVSGEWAGATCESAEPEAALCVLAGGEAANGSLKAQFAEAAPAHGTITIGAAPGSTGEGLVTNLNGTGGETLHCEISGETAEGECTTYFEGFLDELEIEASGEGGASFVEWVEVSGEWAGATCESAEPEAALCVLAGGEAANGSLKAQFAEAAPAHGTITIGAAPGSTGEGLVTNLNGTGGETLHCEISGETAEGECTTYFEGFLDELEIEASGEGGASFVEWVEVSGEWAGATCESAEPEAALCVLAGGEAANGSLKAQFAEAAPAHGTITIGAAPGSTGEGLVTNLNGTGGETLHCEISGETAEGECTTYFEGFLDELEIEASGEGGASFVEWVEVSGEWAGATCESAEPEAALCVLAGGEAANGSLKAQFAEAAPAHGTITIGAAPGSTGEGLVTNLNGTGGETLHCEISGETAEGECTTYFEGFLDELEIEASGEGGASFVEWVEVSGEWAGATCESAEPEAALCVLAGGEAANGSLKAQFAEAAPAHGTITIGAAPGSTGEGLVTNLNGTGGETLHCEISGETAEGECTTYFEGFLDELEIEASGEGGASFVEWVEVSGEWAGATCESAEPEAALCVLAGGEAANGSLKAQFAEAAPAHGTITIGAAPGSTGEGLVTNLNGTGGETLHCEISGETAEGECTTYFEGFLDELEIEASGEGGASFVEWVEVSGEWAGATCESAEPEAALCVLAGGEAANGSLKAQFAEAAPAHGTITIGAAPGSTGEGLVTNLNGTGGETLHCEISGETAEGECTTYFEGFLDELEIEASGEGGASFVEWVEVSGEWAGATCESAEPEAALCVLAGGEAANGSLKAQFAEAAPAHGTITIGAAPGSTGEGLVTNLNGTGGETLHCEISGETAEGECTTYFEGFLDELEIEASGEGGASFVEWVEVSGEWAGATCESAEPEAALCVLAGGEAANGSLKAQFAEAAPAHGTITIGAAPGSTGEGLVTNLNGTGGETLHCEISGETAEGECTTYFEGFLDELEIEASGEGGASFVEWVEVSGEWAGATCESAEPEAALCVLAGGEAANGSLKAQFAEAAAGYNLTVESEGPGYVEGPSGIHCPGGPCSAEFPVNVALALTAGPAAQAEFVEWIGCDAPAGTECVMTMSEAKTVKAIFAPKTHTLTVDVSGPGEVSGGPTSGCEEGPVGTCSGSVDEESTVILTATEAEHAEFVEWGAGECLSNPTATECEVKVEEADKTVHATFQLEAGLAELTVHKAGFGKGTIATVPASGLSCGPECTEEGELFGETETITLKATPQAPGSIFVSWSSNCAPSGALECEIEVGSGADVTATFIAAAVVTPIAPGGECGEAEGIKIEYAGASYNICGGEAGETPTITEFTGGSEPVGEPCNGNGGTMIELGVSTTYVCNGEAGEDGEDGETPTITVTTFSTPGEHGCPEGGSDVDFALGATHTHAYICNGEKGAQGDPGETPTITEFSGGSEPAGNPCSGNGGVDIALGASHTYVCNGADGVDGTNGANGAPGAPGAPGATGPQGPAGQNGSDGANGQNGSDGAQGPQGAQGPRGKRGPAGRVTCRVSTRGRHVKVVCRLKTGKSNNNKNKHKKSNKRGNRRRLRWALISGGHARSHGKTTIHRLNRVLGHLKPGRYVLHVQGQRQVIVIPAHTRHGNHHHN